MVIPDFYIIGAPKCGTTALSNFIARHKDVCFSFPKETHFFMSDINLHTKIQTVDEYNNCFVTRNSSNLVGEGSVWYIYSDAALQKIRSINSNSKIIVLTRDPVHLIESIHAHFVFQGYEDVCELDKAIELVDDRVAGLAPIPSKCPDKFLLNYKAISQLGSRIEYVQQLFSKENVLVVNQSSLFSDARGTYLEVLGFLGLRDDDFRDFSVLNTRKKRKRTFLFDILNFRPKLVRKLVNSIKSFLKVSELGFSRFIYPYITTPQNSTSLNLDKHPDLRKLIEMEVKKLNRIDEEKLRYGEFNDER